MLVRKYLATAFAPSMLLLSVCLSTGSASAETYPSRPITMIVPFPAGGPTDSVARIVADGMRHSLGQSVVISNIAGASGSIGGARGARAAADGYTISFGTWSTHVVNGVVFKLNYDPLNDFEPIALVSDNPVMLVSRNSFPAKTVPELVAWLRANPDKATSGTAGVTTPPSIAAAFFQQQTNTRFQLVHYQTVGSAMLDLMADRIDLIFDFVGNSQPQVQAGKVRAFAVLSKSRLRGLPDVPTADEVGLPGLYMSSWQAMWAPKATSDRVRVPMPKWWRSHGARPACPTSTCR